MFVKVQKIYLRIIYVRNREDISLQKMYQGEHGDNNV